MIYPTCGAILQWDLVFFSFPVKLSQVLAGYALCCMFVLPVWRAQGSYQFFLLFPKFLQLIPIAL